MIDWSVLGPFVIITILVALLFDFYNGVNDSSNSIATVVATRALPPWLAVLLAGTFNFIGAFAGTAVAATVGSGIIEPSIVSPVVIMAGLLGGLVWTAIATNAGIPISVSHSLIGGLVGAGLGKLGLDGLQLPDGMDLSIAAAILGSGVVKGAILGLAVGLLTRSRLLACVLVGAAAGSAANLAWAIMLDGYKMQKVLATFVFIVYSPLIGFIVAFAFMTILAWMLRRVRPGQVKGVFRWLQIGSSSFYSYGHGTNDAQKTMGVITALLLSVGALPNAQEGEFPVPWEVIVAAGLAISLGTMIGGYKVVRTMGTKLTHLDTSQGFVAETSSALGLKFLADYGVPVSTTHSITGSILGVGSFQRVSAVSWGVARRIVMAWIITIPASAMVSVLSFYALRAMLGQS